MNIFKHSVCLNGCNTNTSARYIAIAVFLLLRTCRVLSMSEHAAYVEIKVAVNNSICNETNFDKAVRDLKHLVGQTLDKNAHTEACNYGCLDLGVASCFTKALKRSQRILYALKEAPNDIPKFLGDLNTALTTGNISRIVPKPFVLCGSAAYLPKNATDDDVILKAIVEYCWKPEAVVDETPCSSPETVAVATTGGAAGSSIITGLVFKFVFKAKIPCEKNKVHPEKNKKGQQGPRNQQKGRKQTNVIGIGSIEDDEQD